MFYSKHCSMIFPDVNIWLVHRLSSLNPACSCLSSMSIAVSIRPSKILQKTFDGPAMGCLASCYSYRILPSLWDIGNQAIGSVLRNYIFVPVILEQVCEDPDCGVEVTLQHHSIYILLLSLSLLLWVGVGVARCSGSGQLRTSLKCCTHLTACALSVKWLFPSLSFTGAEWPVFLAQSCFVVLYTTLISPLAAAHCVLRASNSTKALLSVKTRKFHTPGVNSPGEQFSRF